MKELAPGVASILPSAMPQRHQLTGSLIDSSSQRPWPE
jgi:hypothetical protein